MFITNNFQINLVVFFDQVVHWVGGSGLSGNYTFQIVLHQNGNIDFKLSTNGRHN